jgi:hypothetical protein
MCARLSADAAANTSCELSYLRDAEYHARTKPLLRPGSPRAGLPRPAGISTVAFGLGVTGEQLIGAQCDLHSEAPFRVVQLSAEEPDELLHAVADGLRMKAQPPADHGA